MLQQTSPQNTLTKKDFASSQDVRWCPGCGDYSILAAMQATLPLLGLPKEKIVFVSGIGCSSRFPHYMSTYGFHTIHGRAPAFATGLKLANPDLSVWVITGDGDGLSIGGNHLIHALRRNVDLKILLFNNKIYGLTKGQYSPTSDIGTIAKSTPYGSLDRAFNPCELALAAQASFVARTIDTDPKHMQEVFLRAAAHKGSCFIEILQNCVIFNDKTHADITAPQTRDEHQLRLKQGEQLLFGKADEQKAITFDRESMSLKVVSASEKFEPLLHDENATSPVLAQLLATLHSPSALGVLRCIEGLSSYEEDVYAQNAKLKAAKGPGKLEKLLFSADSWTIE